MPKGERKWQITGGDDNSWRGIMKSWDWELKTAEKVTEQLGWRLQISEGDESANSWDGDYTLLRTRCANSG